MRQIPIDPSDIGIFLRCTPHEHETLDHKSQKYKDMARDLGQYKDMARDLGQYKDMARDLGQYKDMARDLGPRTLNPKPQTLNLEPETLSQAT
jgi:hypothetical protein